MEPKPLKAADRPAPAAGKAGGVYIPPFKLAAMMREAKVCTALGMLRSSGAVQCSTARLAISPHTIYVQCVVTCVI